jgi:hypothetical protein
MSPEIALQTMVVELLKADAAVAAIVGEKVVDEVPADRAPDYPPLVEMGPINRTRVEGCGRSWLVRMRLFCTSTEFGRVEAWDLADAVVLALDDDPERGPPPALPAPFHIADALRVVQAGDVIDPLQIKSVFVDVQAIVART